MAQAITTSTRLWTRRLIMPGEVALISEGLFAVIEVWRELQRQKGISEAQINEAFDLIYPRFMAASKDPVKPPTEN